MKTILLEHDFSPLDIIREQAHRNGDTLPPAGREHSKSRRSAWRRQRNASKIMGHKRRANRLRIIF
jgi:hypothetical protein